MSEDKARKLIDSWRNDWNKFVREALKMKLDKEQQAIVEAVQHNKMVTVASGTSRGKDAVAACCAVSFMYLTPRWKDGMLIENTKVALTGPSNRQVINIMIPEVMRLYRNAGFLPGRKLSNGIRTKWDEWFLTGFKADDENTEAWSGFHAVNTMFVVTEASGISETIYNAIEGNLQNNSRLLLVFNPNRTSGYAANSMKQERFKKFRLNSLNATNVVAKKMIIPGQVDYDWVKDKVTNWCMEISADDTNDGEGDFFWEGKYYRPNDLFRVKVLGMFPKVSEDFLIPYEWIEIANDRWREMQANGNIDLLCKKTPLRLGVDIAGMGRDSSVLCERYGSYVNRFVIHDSGGKADHMAVAGMIVPYIRLEKDNRAFIDTIGEGAGVYSRLDEQGFKGAISAKFSESANGLNDVTGQYQFANMRAYCYWAMRDWLDPKNKNYPALPPNDRFVEEVTDTHWKFQSNGSIIIESKEDIKKRIKRSPDVADSLAITFYPHDAVGASDEEIAGDFL